MKQWKLKKLLQGILLGTCLSPWAISYAAQQELLWGNTQNYSELLKKFALVQPSSNPENLQLAANVSKERNSSNTFQFLKGFVDETQESHVRYDQYYQGIPVWGKQIIYHLSAQKNAVTGSIIKGIEQDVASIEGKISLDQAKTIAIGKNLVPQHMFAEKIIYFNPTTSKAMLAYHISYANKTAQGPSIPSFIIDANSGKILQEWNALNTEQKFVGQGPGGSDLNQGIYKYQFGTKAVPGLNAFRKIGLDVQNNICFVSSPGFRVINLKNVAPANLGFGLPVSTADETSHELNAFVYYCSAPDYINTIDNGFAPIHHGISPVNDAAYFVRQTINMFLKQYKLEQPAGPDLPLRVYTHIADYDNSFACGTTCMKNAGITGPQQLVFGNGQALFAPMTGGDVVAHEFGHLVTNHYSTLVYAEQSGGLNEAFSDMTGMALDYYERVVLKMSWYKNGSDWNFGTGIPLNSKAIRYMWNPPLDGMSIDNASKFVAGMDPHLSSGVFNKMFYLLGTSSDWTLPMAYQVMLDANMKFWSASTNWNDAACGVLSAAEARHYPTNSLIKAFSGVGVMCSVSHDKIMEVAHK